MRFLFGGLKINLKRHSALCCLSHSQPHAMLNDNFKLTLSYCLAIYYFYFRLELASLFGNSTINLLTTQVNIENVEFTAFGFVRKLTQCLYCIVKCFKVLTKDLLICCKIDHINGLMISKLRNLTKNLKSTEVDHL